jgi:cytochrome P450
MAFSAGVRGCIGTRFALAEAVAILANLVYSYEILLTPEAELKLKKMEERGVGREERMHWLCMGAMGLTMIPDRARVQVRKRRT